MKGKNQEEAKRINRNLTMKMIMIHKTISRAELARITGLTKMSLTNIVNELLSEGMVEECGCGDAAHGRKPVLLRIKPRAVQIVGIYLSRTAIHSFSGDYTGTVWGHRTYPLEGETVESFREKLRQAVAAQYTSKTTAISISAIGPLQSEKGVLLNLTDFFGIREENLFELLSDYSCPIFLENDMNASAVAEQYFGHAAGVRNFIYLGVARGVGAGIVINHRLFTGDAGFGGEIGHMTIDWKGERCECGNVGCLELYIPKRIEDWESPKKEEAFAALGAAAVTLANLLDPYIIILGHNIAVVPEAPERISAIVNERMLASRRKTISVQPSAFGRRAPIYGAIAVAADRLLKT